MRQDEFVTHLTINNLEVDVGIDDYGQCYFFEYTDTHGKKHSEGCGTYNILYLQYIYAELDPEYKRLQHIYYMEEDGFNPEDMIKWNNYNDMFKQLYKTVEID